jgi:phospholipid transport system substrate-binding protein
MNIRWFRLSRASAGVLAVGLFATAPQGSAREDPGRFIGNLGSQAIRILGPGVPPERRTIRFSTLFEEDFDVPGIGRFALGRYWRSATPQEQREFLGLFQQFTVQVYGARLGQYGGLAFRVTASRPDGEETVVASEIRRVDGSTIRLDWHLVKRDGRYKVADIDVGGLSMKMAEREQFASWIEKNDGRVDALLAVLRQLVAPAR